MTKEEINIKLNELKEQIAQLNQESIDMLIAMKSCVGEEWKMLENARYEIKQEKFKLTTEAGKLVRARMALK